MNQILMAQNKLSAHLALIFVPHLPQGLTGNQAKGVRWIGLGRPKLKGCFMFG